VFLFLNNKIESTRALDRWAMRKAGGVPVVAIKPEAHHQYAQYAVQSLLRTAIGS